LAYVTRAADGADEACIFCVASDADGSLVLHRGTHAFVILNKFPYNNGHLMVAPTRHIAKLAEATPDELSEVMALTRLCEIVLTEAYHPHGMNLGMNLGRPAGAGVPEHFHMHLVPRWNGDTNFMSVVGDTRVVPETPDQTIARLKPLFETRTDE
jgi:ATP adenylyltransferase